MQVRMWVKSSSAFFLVSAMLMLSGCHVLGGSVFHQSQILGPGKEWRMYPVLADVNHDNQIDMVAANRRPLDENSLHIWLGSSGQFSEIAQSWTSPGYSGLAVGDIDGDGNQDIVAASHFSRVHTYIANGSNTGSFKEYVMEALDGYVSAKIVDIDRDGVMDLVLLGNEKAGVEIYSWAGSGWVFKKALQPGIIGRDLRIVDINRDGRLDIIACMVRLGVVIFLQNEKGGWSSAPPTDFFSATKEFKSMDVADLNGDGWDDIALNGGYVGRVGLNGADVYLSNGAALGWTAASTGLKIFKKPAEGIAVGDFNRDGFADLVVGGNETGEMSNQGFGLFLFAGDGKGGWQLVNGSGLPRKGVSRPYGLLARDINNDGAVDLVAIHGAPEDGNGEISVWLNNARATGIKPPA